MPDRAYFSRHLAVYRERGKAASYDCEECGKPARHWAQTHDTDGNDPWNDYRALCFKCHMVYDKGGVKQDPDTVARRTLAIHNTIRADNISGIPGVHWHKVNRKWRVQVRRVNGGSFDNLEDAIAARNALAAEIYGPGSKKM